MDWLIAIIAILGLIGLVFGILYLTYRTDIADYKFEIIRYAIEHKLDLNGFDLDKIK